MTSGVIACYSMARRLWKPGRPVATRPLAFRQYGKTETFLMHDGNKNVTDVVTVGPANTPVAHVDYAPFGAATLSGIRASDNPFRFSSEFHDDTLGLVYYNYRHYNPTDGRWIGRDLIEIPNLYLFNPSRFDFVGLIAREDLQWLLHFFLECSTSTDITEDLRKAYSEAFKLLADKIENLDDKEKRAGLLDRVKKILNESLDAIDALEARLATERDADKKSRIKEALEIANNTVNVLSVVNATSGEITPKDVSRVLTYFLDMTSKSLPSGLESYFTYLKQGADASLQLITQFDNKKTKNAIRTAQDMSNGDCPCTSALTPLTNLGGEMSEIRSLLHKASTRKER